MHGPQPMQRNHSYLTYTYLLVQGRHLINTFVRYLSKGPVGMDASTSQTASSSTKCLDNDEHA